MPAPDTGCDGTGAAATGDAAARTTGAGVRAGKALVFGLPASMAAALSGDAVGRGLAAGLEAAFSAPDGGTYSGTDWTGEPGAGFATLGGAGVVSAAGLPGSLSDAMAGGTDFRPME